jgi:hypothetical protein
VLIERCSFGVSPSARIALTVARAVQTRTWPNPTYRTWSAAYASVSTAATSARRLGASRGARLPLTPACFAPQSRDVRPPAVRAATNASVTRHTTSTAGSARKAAAGARRLAALSSWHWAEFGPTRPVERSHLRGLWRRTVLIAVPCSPLEPVVAGSSPAPERRRSFRCSRRRARCEAQVISPPSVAWRASMTSSRVSPSCWSRRVVGAAGPVGCDPLWPVCRCRIPMASARVRVGRLGVRRSARCRCLGCAAAGHTRRAHLVPGLGRAQVTSAGFSATFAWFWLDLRVDSKAYGRHKATTFQIAEVAQR